jgi:hypothetical protein
LGEGTMKESKREQCQQTGLDDGTATAAEGPAKFVTDATIQYTVPNRVDPAPEPPSQPTDDKQRKQ